MVIFGGKGEKRMNCTACNQELREGIVFCTHCGTNVKESKQTAEIKVESQSKVNAKWDDAIACLDKVLVEEAKAYQSEIATLKETLHKKDTELENLQNEIKGYQQQISNLEKELETEKTKGNKNEEDTQLVTEEQEYYCTNCSNKLEPEMSFCNQCGTKTNR